MPTQIIKLYADWCGHCIQMAPEWNIMKSILTPKKNSPEIIEIESNEMYKLDNINNKLKNKIELRGYPTLVKIKNGKVSYYKGIRDSKNMVKWASSDTNKTKKKKPKRKNQKKRTLRKKN